MFGVFVVFNVLVVLVSCRDFFFACIFVHNKPFKQKVVEMQHTEVLGTVAEVNADMVDANAVRVLGTASEVNAGKEAGSEKLGEHDDDVHIESVLEDAASVAKWLRHLYEPSQASKVVTQRLHKLLKHFIHLIDVGRFLDDWRSSQWGYDFMGSVDVGLTALKKANNLGETVEKSNEAAALQRLYDEGIEDVYDDDSDKVDEVLNMLLTCINQDHQDNQTNAAVIQAKQEIEQLKARMNPFLATNAQRIFDALNNLVGLLVYDGNTLPKDLLDDARQALNDAKRLGIHSIKRMWDF